MHVFDARRRFFGGNAIVAGGLPLAVGLALADKLLGRARVTCCFFGDGAVAEGEFHESLNLAALWRLPVLFVCENNLYAMGTAISRALAVPEIHRHAERYGIAAQVVDGMDVVEVEAAAGRAVAAVRAGTGPQLLENRTYRFCAHSMFDAELYRDKAEVERWKTRDPVRCFSAWLRENGFLHDQDIAAIEADVASAVADAVAFAEAAPWEPVETLTRDVYTPHDRAPDTDPSVRAADTAQGPAP
jgi:TPP-dependent pyruvate/acetoin dehydrogenase alpha subunit